MTERTLSQAMGFDPADLETVRTQIERINAPRPRRTDPETWGHQTDVFEQIAEVEQDSCQ